MKKEDKDINNLVFKKLDGYSGIRLKNGKPLTFKPGINLLIGRNGSGKTNLLRLIQMIASSKDYLEGHVESSFFLKKAKAALNKSGSDINKKFGKPVIASFRLKGREGTVRIVLRNVPEEFVLKNIVNDPVSSYGGVALICNSEPVSNQMIYGNSSAPKFEMSGYLNNSGVLSGDRDNVVQKAMQEPIQTLAQFIKNRLKEFYESSEFVNKISEFEEAVNKKFQTFLGTASKRVKISYNEVSQSGRISMSLTDNGNFIKSENISTGEAILYNLVFALTAVKRDGCEILSFDEPDVHMHDDMVQILVNELSELSAALPSCIINVASHSTALIEKLSALGKERVHIITFDNNREVSNSEKDIELINALQRNGVHFSALMLSRRKNIFIENQFEKGRGDKEFFLKFFSPDHLPNIVPIGNSGNVQDSTTFAGAFEEILKIRGLDCVGIQDGDMWIKNQLIKYLSGDLKLDKFINNIKKQKGFYIAHSNANSNAFYFNCWEIENLYLMDELLSCWKMKNGAKLTKSIYRELLRNNQAILINEYLGTFFKWVTRIKIDKKYSFDSLRTFLQKRFKEMDNSLSDASNLESRVQKLAESLLSEDLLHWVPGKEIKKFLQGQGYKFDSSEFNFDQSRIAAEIRKILGR